MSTIHVPECPFVSKTPMKPEDFARLAVCEAVIAEKLGAFLEVGNALVEISDQRLYRETHCTFDEYVKEKWAMTAKHAYRLCTAAEVVREIAASVVPAPEGDTTVRKVLLAEKEMSPIGDKPAVAAPLLPIVNEAQARELAKAPKGKRAAVLKEAQETAPDGKVTAKHIAAVVEKSKAQPSGEVTEGKPAAALRAKAGAIAEGVNSSVVTGPFPGWRNEDGKSVPLVKSSTAIGEVIRSWDAQSEEIIQSCASAPGTVQENAAALNQLALHLEVIARRFKDAAKRMRLAAVNETEAA